MKLNLKMHAICQDVLFRKIVETPENIQQNLLLSGGIENRALVVY